MHYFKNLSYKIFTIFIILFYFFILKEQKFDIGTNCISKEQKFDIGTNYISKEQEFEI